MCGDKQNDLSLRITNLVVSSPHHFRLFITFPQLVQKASNWTEIATHGIRARPRLSTVTRHFTRSSPSRTRWHSVMFLHLSARYSIGQLSRDISPLTFLWTMVSFFRLLSCRRSIGCVQRIAESVDSLRTINFYQHKVAWEYTRYAVHDTLSIVLYAHIWKVSILLLQLKNFTNHKRKCMYICLYLLITAPINSTSFKYYLFYIRKIISKVLIYNKTKMY